MDHNRSAGSAASPARSAPQIAQVRAEAIARSVCAEPSGGESGEVAARAAGAQAAPVFDEVQMSDFVAQMGADWVARNLPKFAIDVEARLTALDAATPADLFGIVHGMISMASACGFTELLGVCELVQGEAREGSGLSRIADLRAAGERALAAMRSYRLAHQPVPSQGNITIS